MKHLDLFSGIGGFSLACQWNGIETIGFVEIDKYCQKVLRKHWPNVPIVEDIRDVEAIKEIVANTTQSRGSMDGGIIGIQKQEQLRGSDSKGDMGCQRTGEHRSGIGKQSTEPLPAILVTAGFPCQPFSVAGKRQGERDDRYLWPQTIAVIKEIKPSWVLLENVTGIINLALDTVLSDLEGAGYSTETLIIPACAVNAWHRRDRIWIVGFANEFRLQEQGVRRLDFQLEQSSQGIVAFPQSRESRAQAEPEGWEDTSRRSQEDVAGTHREQGQESRNEQLIRCGGISDSSQWTTQSRLGGMVNGIPPFVDGHFDTEPAIPRVATGVKNRVDRLKCLGNAIVPILAYEIIKVIKKVRHG